MTHPQSKEEYLARFQASQSVEGYGIDTAQVMPCPFCAAPRWMVAKIIEFEAEASKDHECGECGRSAKLIFVHDGPSVSFELVQTGGPDPADWLEPALRRVDR